MVDKKICPECGKRQFRFRVAFGSWICDSCKFEKKQEDYRSGEVINLNNWWAGLSLEDKIKIRGNYEKS